MTTPTPTEPWIICDDCAAYHTSGTVPARLTDAQRDAYTVTTSRTPLVVQAWIDHDTAYCRACRTVTTGNQYEATPVAPEVQASVTLHLSFDADGNVYCPFPELVDDLSEITFYTEDDDTVEATPEMIAKVIAWVNGLGA